MILDFQHLSPGLGHPDGYRPNQHHESYNTHATRWAQLPNQAGLILAVLLAVVCVSSAQFPAGWNYNPYLYYPYSALQPPAQETAEVAAARASHMAAHAAAARGKRSIEDTPEVRAATIEHYRLYNEAALANGIVAYLPAKYANMAWGMPQQVQNSPEVAAARRAYLAAHALAATRG